MRGLRLHVDYGHRGDPNLPALRLFADVILDAVDLVHGVAKATSTLKAGPVEVEADVPGYATATSACSASTIAAAGSVGTPSTCGGQSSPRRERRSAAREVTDLSATVGGLADSTARSKASRGTLATRTAVPCWSFESPAAFGASRCDGAEVGTPLLLLRSPPLASYALSSSPHRLSPAPGWARPS